MPDVAKLYGKVFTSAFNKEIDFNSDTIKAMLCTSAYTPDQDTHQYKSDVTNEITGTGYTAGGVTLANCTISYDGATNTLKLDCDDFSWTGATFTARNLVIYDSTPGSDATRPLIMYVTFAADIPVTSSTFSVTVNAGGLCTVTVS
ncbi:hypothetical protein [Nocardia wallacei]|uniref:hypothetical protein n=1 Tax=Nocardia wallacei TaxID=480035 RepID=UPI00245702A9|nr:hypothetical protein [Nocardia wallacei]